MKVLVTGGTGFIGSHLVDLLVENGHEVRLLSRKAEMPGRWKGKCVKVLPGDLRHPETVVDAMTGADVVFHIGEIKNTTNARAKQNAELVRKMVAGLGNAGVRRFVFVSSLTVAGIPSASPADERTGPAFKLNDQYTAYKAAAEEIIRSAPSPVEHMILRPGIVYGPGSRYLGSMLRLVKQAGPIGIPFFNSGRSIAPFIHVTDLARALYLAGVKAEVKNETFNITDGMDRTWQDFLFAIGRAYGRSVRILPLPALLFRVPAVFVDLFAGFLGFAPDMGHYIDYLSRNIYFGNNKARTLLDWEPQMTDLDAAVRKMTEWYAGNKKTDI
ncbi:MAG: NAD(P)-dependent oxidoreductase [Nitrospirota bacterium]|nr:NAD(P)-dependent oxidoreductase [Nitrospirota bacterium]